MTLAGGRRARPALIIAVLAGRLLLAPLLPTSSVQASTTPAAGSGTGFEQNVGQADPAVRYLARAGGATLLLTAAGPIVALPPPVAATPGREPLPAEAALLRAAPPQLVHVTYLGARTDRLGGGAPLRSRTSYLLGSDPAHWHTDVPAVASVTYADLYPGISLTYSTSGGALESTYQLDAGADAARIAFRYDGARSVAVSPQGDLEVALAAFGGAVTLRERAPTAWQEAGRLRRAVPVSFSVDAAGDVGLRLGAHDAALPVTVDPVLGYSTYLGGSQLDHPWAVATDAAGDTYVTGYTYSTDYPVTPGALQPDARGSSDVFVSELDPAGALVFSTYLGGSDFDNAFGLHVDAAGDVLVTGATVSTDFPVTSGAYATANPGGSSAFVSELAPGGERLVASTYLGGSVPVSAQVTPVRVPPQVDDEDLGTGIDVDSTGAVYISGETDSVNFPVTPSAVQPVEHGDYDGFVARLSPHLDALDYATYIGGNGYDFAAAIVVDAVGDAYVTGESTSSLLFPTTSGAFQTSQSSGLAAWVAKLDPTGGRLVYSTLFGGSSESTCSALHGNYTAPSALAVDATGDAYIAGETNDTDLPTTAGVVQPAMDGCNNAYVTAFDPTGSRLVLSSYLGGGDYDGAFGLALDGARDLYLCGYSSWLARLPVTADAFQHAHGGGTFDAFVAELGPGASAVRWLSYLGGSGDDYCYGAALDAGGGVHLTGITTSQDFPAAGATQSRLAGTCTDSGCPFDGFATLVAAPTPAVAVPEAPLLLLLPLVGAAVLRRREARTAPPRPQGAGAAP